MAADAWLEIKDAAGARRVPIDKDVFAIGRRTGNDLKLNEADISREHADLSREGGVFTLRDRQSRFGTFVNGERVTERALTHGDLIRLGQNGGVEMVFLSQPVVELNPSAESHAERTMTSAGSEFRQVAALLEGLRALGSARVLDEVLALVIDSAIELSGA